MGSVQISFWENYVCAAFVQTFRHQRASASVMADFESRSGINATRL
jgi:hypothetical protein